MNTVTLDLNKLNATQLARLWVTLRELGRNDEAAEVNRAGIVNCGFVDFVAECNMLRSENKEA